MTPQDIQAAAMANLMKLQAGGGAGPLGQQGGYGSLNRVTSRVPPVMPGTRIEEDMPQFDTRTMGNRQAGPPPGGLEAILRRLGGGGMPGGDTTARPVPGDHIGLSELAQGSLLDQLVQRLQSSQRMQSPTSMIPGVPPGVGIEEDMPQWDWRTMGNQRRGVTDALSGKRRIEKSNAPRVGRAGRAR